MAARARFAMGDESPISGIANVQGEKNSVIQGTMQSFMFPALAQ